MVHLVGLPCAAVGRAAAGVGAVVDGGAVVEVLRLLGPVAQATVEPVGENDVVSTGGVLTLAELLQPE